MHGGGWNMKRSTLDLSDGMFALVVLAAAVIGATAGTTLVWVYDRYRG